LCKLAFEIVYIERKRVVKMNFRFMYSSDGTGSAIFGLGLCLEKFQIFQFFLLRIKKISLGWVGLLFTVGQKYVWDQVPSLMYRFTYS